MPPRLKKTVGFGKNSNSRCAPVKMFPMPDKNIVAWLHMLACITDEFSFAHKQTKTILSMSNLTVHDEFSNETLINFGP